MAKPMPFAVTIMTIAAAGMTSASCAGGGGSGDARGDGPPPAGLPSAAPSGGAAEGGPRDITAAQLENALLTQVSGYERLAGPESGTYGKLKSVRQSSQFQQAARPQLNKPQCARATEAFTAKAQNAPAATVGFDKGGEVTFAEVLMAVPDAVAKEQIGYRVPYLCRSYRATFGNGQQFDYRVVTGDESAALRLGAGARTLGMAVTAPSGRVNTKIWTVVFRDDDYVGSVALTGPKVTRADVEELARSAYQQAERVLG